MKYFKKRLIVCCLACLTACPIAWADPKGDAARVVLDQNINAIVMVKMVIKGGMSIAGMGSNSRESKSEATGTIIDPSGLTIVPLSATDPFGSMGETMSSLMEGSDASFSFKSELTDVKMVFEDGTEIPARIVLRDKDLDLAFIRPLEAREQPFKFIDLSNSDERKILDEVVLVDRMTSSADRVPFVVLSRIQSVIERPRKYYVIGDATLGAPIFTPEGKIVGVTLDRKSGGDSSRASALASLLGTSTQTVLPAEDIQEAAAQAPQIDQLEEEPPAAEAAVEEATPEQE